MFELRSLGTTDLEGRGHINQAAYSLGTSQSLWQCIGEGNGNPSHCSCLENPRDRGAWWAAIYGVAQSWTWLRRLSSSMTVHLGVETKLLKWGWVVLRNKEDRIDTPNKEKKSDTSINTWEGQGKGPGNWGRPRSMKGERDDWELGLEEMVCEKFLMKVSLMCVLAGRVQVVCYMLSSPMCAMTPCYSWCGLRICSISNTWELIRQK